MDNTLTVLIDPEPLFHLNGGIGVYTQNLLTGARDIDTIRYVAGYASIRRGAQNSLNERWGAISDYPISHISLPGRFAAIVPRFARYLASPTLKKVDVAHAVDYCAPAWWDRKIPLVVTICDLAFARHPGKSWAPAIRLEKTVPDTLKRASAVLAISEFTASEIESIYKIPRERIFVSPLSSQIFSPSTGGEDTKLPSRPFFLAVSQINPRKNHETLLAAFAEAQKIDPEALLVIVGNRGWAADSIVKQIVAAAPDVVWLENCTPVELATLYRRARAFIMPSWYEGFGLPCLEAMELGCPVIYGKGSSMDEVVGAAGLSIDPSDFRELSAKMSHLWRDDSECKRLIVAGKVKAEEYSVSRTMSVTLEAYRFALEHPRC